MAKRCVTPMGKHKPLRSSWKAMDAKAYSHGYMPENRPEFRCYVSGQFPAMQEQWAKAQKQKQIDAGLAILKTLMQCLMCKKHLILQ